MDPNRKLRKIIVGEIPVEGKRFVGTLDEDIFGLPEGEPQVTTPITYDLNIARHEDLLLATGSLQTSFSLRCVRCLRDFPYRLELRGHTVEVDLAGAETVDLTESLREDILLALPGYPRCEDSSLGSVVCSPGVKVYSPDDPPPELDESGGASKQNVWGALDNLESLNDND